MWPNSFVLRIVSVRCTGAAAGYSTNQGLNGLMGSVGQGGKGKKML